MMVIRHQKNWKLGGAHRWNFLFGSWRLYAVLSSIILFAIALSPHSIMIADEAPRYDARNKRNPFIPYVTNEGKLTNVDVEGPGQRNIAISLEGIIFDEAGQSMVIINGEILRVGDVIGNVKIIEIRRDSISCMKDGEIFVINARREE